MIANLAQPGSLELGDSCIFQDQHKDSNLRGMSAFNLRMARRYAKRLGWPQFQSVALDQAWGWALNQEGFLVGFGDGPTGRALNAFSHLLEETDSPLGLFWAIVGIEALYVRGKEALMEQVREKSQILLGEQIAFKKKISQMYSFRSAFVHGGLNFPGFYLPNDGPPEAEKHESDLMESTNMAISVLTATLQELTTKNWKGMQFSYMIKEID